MGTSGAGRRLGWPLVWSVREGDTFPIPPATLPAAFPSFPLPALFLPTPRRTIFGLSILGLTVLGLTILLATLGVGRAAALGFGREVGGRRLLGFADQHLCARGQIGQAGLHQPG